MLVAELELIKQSINNGLIILMIQSISIFIVALAAHELGHILYFKKLGKSVSVKFCLKHKGLVVGNDYDYLDLSSEQYVKMLLWGVFAGLFVLLFGIVLLGESFAIMLLPYFCFCVSDIENAAAVKNFWEVKEIE